MGKIKLHWHRFWFDYYTFMKGAMEGSTTLNVHELEKVSLDYAVVKWRVRYHSIRCSELEQQGV